MDDWIEIRNGNERIAGLVKELSWRATVLQAITDETITLPNKTIAQSQIVNFSGKERPFLRSQVFRLPYGGQLELAREILLQTVKDTPGVLASPPPVTLISETHESWIVLKVVYAVNDYGNQYLIADRFYQLAFARLAEQGLVLAGQRMELVTVDPRAKI